MTTERKIWFCSDLLLGAEESTRDKGYEQYFFNAWSHSVRKNDVVCILGNVALRNVVKSFETIAALPGLKTLVMGPEDKNKPYWYQKFGFVQIIPFGRSTIMRHEYGNILLTHVPAYAGCFNNQPTKLLDVSAKHEQEMRHNSAILNIHGHMLGQGAERHNTVDVSLEAIAFAPVELGQITQRKFK